MNMSPLWTFIMTLLTLLTLSHGYVRFCGPEQPKPTITPAEWDPETARRPPEYRKVIIGNPILSGTFSNDITVYCSSSDASKLTIRDARDPDDMQAMQAVTLNSTTIQVLLEKPDVGHYSYFCTDSNTNCSDALYVQIRPAMSVTAPKVHQTLNKYGKTLYFVPLGESYDLFCSAQTTDLSVSWEHELQIKPFNETTVMATVTDHTEGERIYYCGNWDSPLAEIWVMVNYYPEASEIKCVLYKVVVECSWKSSNKGNTFKLFVLLKYYDQESRLICIDRSGALAAGCADSLDEEASSSLLSHYNDISFQLETCNTVFCSNQTFHINIKSNTKSEPVYDLKLRNVSALGANVVWRQDIIDFYSEYKVEYRMLGTDWRSVNASEVQCEYIDVCGIQLAFPCPDTHYELRVFMRYKQATNDVYWSEPASIYFFTAPSSGEVDPACGADFRDVTEKPPVSAKLVLYQVRELISDERKKTKSLKRKMEALKEKLEKVKAIMASRREAEAAASGSAPIDLPRT